MAVRKYASDYRIETHIGPDGKKEMVRIYQGPHFGYCADSQTIQQLSKTVLLGAVLMIVGLLPLLFNSTRIGRTFYVLVPVAFALLPWYLLAVAGWRLKKFQQPLTREQRDQTDKRLRGAAVWLCVLLSLALAGGIAYWILAGLEAGEWKYMAGMLLAQLICVYLLTLRKKAQTKELDAQ